MAARLGRSRPASAYVIHARKYATSPTGGSIASTLPPVTAAMTGEQEFAGPIISTLKPVVAAFTGSVPTVGSVAATLNPVSSGFTGAVIPTGPFSLTLSPLTSSFTSETIQFGERVIHIEAEKRAFRVVDEDPGLISIYSTEVTDL